MKLSQDTKRKYHTVTLLFSLLLGVGVAAYGARMIVGYENAIGMITLSLILAGFSWLSIRLAFAQWKNSHWMLLAMKMVLYFCGMITVPVLISLSFGDIETYPLVMGLIFLFAAVFLLAIVLIIPFGFLSYWLSRLSSTKRQENQFNEKRHQRDGSFLP